MTDAPSIVPAPFRFRLRWVGQGKVAWRRDWVGKYGPTRTHIPNMDEHIGFANYDLQKNQLLTISKDEGGSPFIVTIRPMTESEIRQVHAEMLGYFIHPTRANEVFADRVMRPLADLAATLDVVAYHGFVPAQDSPGLQYLRTLFPPQKYAVEFPDGPQAGL